MNDTNKNKWQIRGAVLVIFLLGFVAGGLALNAYRVWFSPPPAISRQDRLEQTFEQLRLTAEQKSEMQDIFSGVRTEIQAIRQENAPRMQEVRERANERLQKILTAEQWQEFQQIRNASIERRRGGGD